MFSRQFAGGLISPPVTRRAAVAVTAALVASMVATIAPAEAAPAKAGKSAVVPVASRPDAYAAMMAAKKQKSPVEVLDYRTDASQTFANPDGTFSYNAFAQPKWVKQKGAWKDLDATLVRAKNGTWSPATAESSLVLSGGGTGALATMTVDGKQLGLTWPTALPKPTASGATLTYANVLPSGVDLQVTATVAGGVEETLVIKNATAAADPGLADLTQAVSASNGTTVSADAGGNLSDTSGGRLLVNSPAPVMWDSATTAGTTTTAAAAGAHAAQAATVPQPATHSSARTAGNHAHQARVKASFKNHKLHLSADASLLSAKTTVFPVFEDPAFVPHPTSGATMNWDEVQQAYPTTSNYDAAPGTGLAVGYQGFSSPTGIERTYYQVAIPSSIWGSTVISASLNATETYSASCATTSYSIQGWSTNGISSSTNWNNAPAKVTQQGSANFGPACSGNVGGSFNWLNQVTSAAAGHWTNVTFVLLNSSETNDVQFKRFADNPSLSITYNNPPATPANLSVSPSNVVGSTTYTSTGTPTLSASATDANSDTVQYGYQILSGSTVKASGTTAFVNSGSAATWKPTTALADGAYTWQVRAYDGHDYSAWTAAKAFTIDTSTPTAPTVSCTNYPSGQWTASTASTTCTLTDTATDVYGYEWQLDGGSYDFATGSTGSVTFTPGNGWHSLRVTAHSNAGVASAPTYYQFGVGTGGLDQPTAQSSSSNTFNLSASSSYGIGSSTTFQYRLGTSGAFTTVPVSDVTNNGTTLTSWPVADANEVFGGTAHSYSPTLVWNAAHTINDDGLVQIEAVVTNGSNSYTTPPTTVTLDRLGTGTDFGTTQIGPVTVGLQSGNAAVSATDVNIASYGSGLSVARTFNSLKPTVNTGFGPGWNASLPVAGTSASWASITDDGSYALLTGRDGSTLTFAAGTASNGTTPYTGQGEAAADGLTLSKGSAGFTLTDTTGTQVTFVLPTGGVGGLYLPSTVTQPGSGKSTGFVYDPNSGATQGKLMLMVAPDAATSAPNTTACPYPATSASWAVGCRGLQFAYDGTTGNISEIDFLTSDGTTLTKTPVADYTYDSTGRLKYEWDPRITTPLKAMYLYDETQSDSDYGRISSVYPAQDRGQPANVLQPWQLAYDYNASDANYGKLVSVTRTHNATNGGGSAKTVIAYSVPLTIAAGGPADMDSNTVATWGQEDVPTSAVAVFPADHAPSGTITDWTYAQILYFDAQGRQVNTATYNGGWNISTTEHDQFGNTVRELTAANRATALAAGTQSAAVAAQLDTQVLYSSDGTELTDTYGPAHQALAAGAIQTVRDHTHNVYDQGAPNGDKDANGNPYQLVTTVTVGASIGSSVTGGSDVDVRTTQNVYNDGTDNIGWTLHNPLQTITDPGTGKLDITKAVAFNEDSSLYGGEPLQTSSSQPSDSGGAGVGTTRTVYYTAGSNSADSACGNQPAWTDLVCKTEPAAQPVTTGLAGLPVVQYTYNTYLEPVTKTDSYTAADGTSAVRTTTVTYDAAGRQIKNVIGTTGTGMGAAVAPTQTVYDPTTGLTTDSQSLDGSGNVSADLRTTYDDWGQTSTYTDANSRTTSFGYSLAGALTSRSSGGNTTTLTYDEGSDHSDHVTSETDTLAGTFTASYNPDGRLAQEAYPGGTTGTYGYDATGTATGLTYANSQWAGSLSDSVTLNSADDWAARTVLGSSQAYTYDANDRLATVADTQAGQCTTRSYSYDADSNRTARTTGAPATDGSCQTTSTTSQSHAYDAADRITDAGYTYDTLGDITTTPAVDAGGTGALTASYYDNGLVASQSQAGDTVSYQLDPQGERFGSSTDSVTGVTTTDYYADDSDNPFLTTASDGTSTRNVTAFGSLAAEVSGAGTTLQLVDLHGDVMAAEVAGTSDLGPTATYTYTEFGAQETAAASTYGWLGGAQRASTPLGGTILMGVRVYNPNTGRFNQVDPVSGGNANPYDYVYQNPLTNFDIDGKWCGWNWKCYVKGAVRWALMVAFNAVAGVVLALCTGETGGLCGTLFGYLFWHAATAAAVAVFDLWMSSGHHGFWDYVYTGVEAFVIGLFTAGFTRWIPVAIRRQVSNALWSRVAGLVLALSRYL
ncbi:RHS repeat-associated core domain-containing protein [Streptacidiphilus rugosus]|uniref:RHS repeat-associated core domain-containing protein n=1 Tax=Streptacidiphilus rugosus TaxID=405783 RepID=UPI0005672307|nr:RHS repeat-associated core domain-containing protein [Streptacidiphilus rugosus]